MTRGLVDLITPGVRDAGEVSNGRASKGADKEAFLGFLRLFATGERAPARQRAGRPEAPQRAELPPLPPRRARTVERLALLVQDGSLPRAELARQSSAEWEDLEAWAAEGASGLFPPLPLDGPLLPDGRALADPSTEPGAQGMPSASPTEETGMAGAEEPIPEAETAEAAEAAEIVEVVEAAAGAEVAPGAEMTDGAEPAPVPDTLWAYLDELLARAAGDGGPEEAPTTADRLGARVALDDLNGTEKRALMEGLLQALTESAHRASAPEGNAASPADPVALLGDLREAVGLLSGPRLVAALQEAAATARVQTLADRALLDELPAAALRSLAMQVVEAGMPPEDATGMGLLAALARIGAGRAMVAGASEPMTGDPKDAAGAEGTAAMGAEAVDPDQALPIRTVDGEPDEPAASRARERGVLEAPPTAAAEEADRDGREVRRPDAHGRAAVALEDAKAPEEAATRRVPGMETAARDPARAQVAEMAAGKPQPIESGAGSSAGAARAESQGVAGVSSGQETARPVAVAAGETTASRAMLLAENVERIEQVMRLSLQRQMTEVSVQLSPPELGRVVLHVKLTHGAVSANLQTETHEARDLLANGVQQLRQNLQVHGIDLDGFDVQLGGQGLSEGQDGRWAGHAPRRPGRAAASKEQDAEAVSGEVTALGPATLRHDGSVNIIA